jgi:hypothetical protein
LGEVLDSLATATFGATARSPYEAEVRRATQRVLVDQMIALARDAPMPQVRAIATDRLRSRMTALRRPGATGDERAHRALLASDIERFIERPSGTADSPPLPEAPPGAPIGEPSLNWLERLEPPCTLWQTRPWN